VVCIGVPAKRGQTQDTNGRTQPKMAVLPVTVVVRRVPGVQVPREGEKWKEQRRGGRERGGSGVGCLRGELVGAQGVLSAMVSSLLMIALTTLHSEHPVLPPTPLADPPRRHPPRSHPLSAPLCLTPLPHGTGLGLRGGPWAGAARSLSLYAHHTTTTHTGCADPPLARGQHQGCRPGKGGAVGVGRDALAVPPSRATNRHGISPVWAIHLCPAHDGHCVQAGREE